jgi:hypothetical protein
MSVLCLQLGIFDDTAYSDDELHAPPQGDDDVSYDVVSVNKSRSIRKITLQNEIQSNSKGKRVRPLVMRPMSCPWVFSEGRIRL